MEFSNLLGLGIKYGLWLSVLLSLLFIGLARLSPEAWVNDYPPDIRAKYGPMSARAKRLRALSAIPFAIFLFGSVILAMLALNRSGGGTIRFLDAFLVVFCMLLVFNLVDLFVIDWLLFVTVQPDFIILPGTEGMAGYKDYAFHFHAFLKGLAGSALGSLLIALIAWLASLLF